MKGIRAIQLRSARRELDDDAPTRAVAPPPFGEVELVARYLERPVRPTAQKAARAALWAAVCMGCVGGFVSLVRPTGGSVEARPVDVSAREEMVPAPVSDTAEQAVEAWLTATSEDGATLEALFVEPPSPHDTRSALLNVERLTTVAGRRLDDGYWTVTVAAEVSEPSAGRPASDGPTAEDVASPDAQGSSTWFVEVGIVGQVGRGLAALATPAVVPAPPAVSEDWQTVDGVDQIDGDDPLFATVDGFLRALLTGEGDPARYASPSFTATAVNPVPFTEIALQEVSVTETSETARLARAHVEATTQGGVQRILGYELALGERSGRWEVTGFSGTPSLSSTPEPGGSASGGREEETDG